MDVKNPGLGNLQSVLDQEALSGIVKEVASIVLQPTNVALSDSKKQSNRTAFTADKAAEGSGDDFMLALMVLQQELNKNKLLATKGDIKDARNRSEAEHKKNLEKMAESQEKAKEAEKSGMLQKVFGWIATALSVIVAAVITVATLGAGTGVGALICAGVALATTLASTAIQAANEFKVEVNGVKMGAFDAAIVKLAMKDGWDEEKANQIGAYSAMAVQFILAIIGMVASLGAAGVGKLSTIAEMGGKLSAKLATNITNGLKQTGNVLNAMSGVTTVATSASGIHTAVKSKEAQDAQAERLDIKANLKELEAKQRELQEKLQQMMEELQSIFQTIMQILNGNADTANSIIKRTVI